MTAFIEIAVRCPRCGELAVRSAMTSANTLGATVWTDGCVVAPMLPATSPVVRCPACRAVSWLADWEGLAADDPEGEAIIERVRAQEGESGHRTVSETPDEGVLREAIGSGLCVSARQEIELRGLLWRRLNDRFRAEQPPMPSRAPADPVDGWSSQRLDDLEELAGLLRGSADPIDRLTLAEVLRHLGHAREAIEVLDAGGFPDELDPYVQRIRSLAVAGDAWPRPVWGSGEPAT